MSEDTFARLDQARSEKGAAGAIDQLIHTFREQKDYHRLFDALLMKKKHELGLPVVRPTSFEDVPEAKRSEFEAWYIDQAREVGKLFLENKELANAWAYFRTIREPEHIVAALDKMDTPRTIDDKTEELINIALYEGAHPVKGLEILLRTHGTCNTITMLDQSIGQFTPEQREGAAKLLVNQLYSDLRDTLEAEVQKRMALVPPNESISNLITAREWLFTEGNYHIDVSHLNAVVRFARSIREKSPELDKAIQLAEYGSKLDPQFQYPGDPPFENFYESHVHFLKAVAGRDVEASLAYYRKKLQQEPDEQDQVLIASVLIDLLLRVDQIDEALELAEKYAELLEQLTGFTFAQLCQETNRLDVLSRVAKTRGDLLGYTAALVQTSETPSA